MGYWTGVLCGAVGVIVVNAVFLFGVWVIARGVREDE